MKINILKKLLILNTIVVLLSISTSAVFAQTFTPQPVSGTPVITKTPVTFETLKAKAIQEIDRRIEGLTGLITKITSIKKLTDAQKSSLTSQINAEISSLKDLRNKIEADKDLDTLKVDVKSIITSYRVYLFFMPKVEILTFADRLQNIADNMQNLTSKIKTGVDDAKIENSNSNSVVASSQLDTSITSYQSKITEAEALIAAAQNEVISLTVSGYPGNKSILIDARNKLETAKKDLETSKDNFKDLTTKIRDIKQEVEKKSEDNQQKIKSTGVNGESPKVQPTKLSDSSRGNEQSLPKQETPKLTFTPKVEETKKPSSDIKLTSNPDNRDKN